MADCPMLPLKVGETCDKCKTGKMRPTGAKGYVEPPDKRPAYGAEGLQCDKCGHKHDLHTAKFHLA